jgi:phage terminase large subunit GpA-like protein
MGETIKAIDRWRAEVAADARKAFTWSPPLSLVEWSEQVRRMDGGRAFRYSFAPYQREIAETIYDPEVQMVAMMMASRLGKTETVMNAIGHAIDAAPRRILVMYPTTSQAEKWSKETLSRELLAPTPSLEWLSHSGARNPDNRILHKLFPGGALTAVGGNAMGELRRAKASFLFADEVSALSTEKSDEGDQLEILWMRGSEYPDTIRIAASYPSMVGHCRISRIMEGSDFRKWHVPCPRCDDAIVMDRSHIVWTPGKPEGAVVRCPSCGDTFDDDERRRAVADGEWIATKEFTGTAGFHASGMLSPHPVQRGFESHLHWVAQQTEAAEKAANPERARRVIVNTFDALPFQGTLEEKADPADLVHRREPWNPADSVPDGVLCVCWGADVQKDRIEVEFVGFGLNDETWGLGYRVVYGSPLKSQTWVAFDQMIGKTWTHPQLGSITSRAGCIDSRYQSAKVRNWTRGKHTRNIFAIVGSTILGKPPVSTPKRVGRPPVVVYELGTHELKDIIYQRLELVRDEGETEWPQGFMHYPAVEDYHDDYFAGLTIEDSVMKKGADGNDYRWFEKPRGARNEPLDVRVYAMAAFAIARPPLPALAKKARDGVKDAPVKKVARKTRKRQVWAMPSL